MANAYPLNLDLTDREILIVGGGAVAFRKAAGLLAAGAGRIRVVAREIIRDFPADVERKIREYDPSDLDGAFLVFAATDSESVNNQIVRDCKARSVLVNRADSSLSDPGDFTTPALFQNGAVLVTVSAGSAALAVMIREGLAKSFNPAWSAMADAMQSLRPMIRDDKTLDADDRRNLLRRLATEEAVEVLAREGLDGLKSWLQRDPCHQADSVL